VIPLRAFEILAALQRHRVEFVVIGGFSLAAHGAQRGTKDVDIVPDPAPDNLSRLGSALAALNARVDLKDLDAAELGIEPDADGLALGGNWVLETDSGLLDVLQEVAGVRGYAQLRQGAVALELPQLERPLLCAGVDDLIAMKTAAGRPQDLIDVTDLLRARGELD
jgi:hypothetical protein